jgi:hypothetical protein
MHKIINFIKSLFKSTTCSKCLTKNPIIERRIQDGHTYRFCELCSFILNKDPRTGNLLYSFLRDDFRGFPINEKDKNIINSRLARNTDNSPWNKIKIFKSVKILK